MTEEFNLSKKINDYRCNYDGTPEFDVLEIEDVKEFIRLLKEEFPINCKEHHKFHNKIDALAGDKLE